MWTSGTKYTYCTALLENWKKIIILFFSVKHNDILSFNWLANKLNDKLNNKISLCLIEKINLLLYVNATTQQDVLYTTQKKKITGKALSPYQQRAGSSTQQFKTVKFQISIINLQ